MYIYYHTSLIFFNKISHFFSLTQIIFLFYIIQHIFHDESLETPMNTRNYLYYILFWQTLIVYPLKSLKNACRSWPTFLLHKKSPGVPSPELFYMYQNRFLFIRLPQTAPLPSPSAPPRERGRGIVFRSRGSRYRQKPSAPAPHNGRGPTPGPPAAWRPDHRAY